MIALWVNGTRDRVADDASLASVLADRGVSPAEVSVLLNGTAIARDALQAHGLQCDDRVDFVHFHGGG